MSVSSVTSAPLFSKDLYTVNVDGVPYDSTKDYGVDAVYTVTLNYTVDEVPLALLFAAMQIGLADIASYQAESYMQQIRDNQEAQIAAKQAIAEAKAMQDATANSVGEYVSNRSGWTAVADFSTRTFPTPIYTSDEGVSEEISIDVQTLADCFRDQNIYAIENMGTILCTDKVVNHVAESGVLTSTTTYSCTGNVTCLKNNGTVGPYILTFTVRQTESNDGMASSLTVVTVDEDLTLNGTLSSIYPPSQLTDELVKQCYILGISEIDGVQLYEVDANGDAILDADGNPISTTTTLTDAQLDDLIDELELKLETVSSTLQTDMLYAEEYLGQFNSYLSGGSSSIDELNTTLQSIAQRI